MNIRGLIFSIVFAAVFLFSGWQVLQLFWAQGELVGLLILDAKVFSGPRAQTIAALGLEVVAVLGGVLFYTIATIIAEGNPFTTYYQWICSCLKTEQP